ncbi:DUF4238 domain-containing protein [Bacillus sp. Marseille-Q3570]|uniref:DUF4238 domain-containing protein n=1 Tax=Bacillus sp. Marseille-Q3570 TaxID=2963522 RepID=UPI0021B7DB8B|nr:DUF4238 domain-containing protein [Bacillus sp. Marseille-Q3570]
METKAVYHHLTPQTYMKAWKHGKSSVYVVDKGTNGVGTVKNTKNFAGINNYHSLRAGSLFRTEEDCKKFFKPLDNYIVKINDKVVKNRIEMNNRFYKYNTWIIINNNAEIIDEAEKKALKKDILSIHVRDIEVGWDRQYENYWNSINKAISYEVCSNPFIVQSIPAVKRTNLIKFAVSMEWRTRPYHPVLEETFDWLMSEKFFGLDFKSIYIPENERLYPFLQTMYDEFAHSYILKLYRQFLDGKGVIMDEANNFINNSCVCLLIAPDNGEFITSDNPVCRITNKEGTTEYIFPINPKIACLIVKGSAQESYLLKHLTKDELIYYNNKLKENCNLGYILRKQNRLLYFNK